MKLKLYIFYLIGSGIFLSSCYQDINLDEYQPASKPVLNCVINPDTIVMASISRTWFFTEQKPNICLKDAKVELFIDGIFKEQMQWMDTNTEALNTKGIYTSTIIPKPGEVVKIVASTGFGTAWAEDTIPSKTNIIGVTSSHRYFDNGNTMHDSNGNTSYINIDVKYEITFQDDPARDDYYLIRISAFTPYSLTSFDYSSDPVFLDQQSILETSGIHFGGENGRTFSDKTINGKKYTLVVKETGTRLNFIDPSQRKRKITLYRLSKAYYQYLITLQYFSDNNNMQELEYYGLVEPKRVFSNVQGGTGIMGASHCSNIEIDLGEPIPSD